MLILKNKYAVFLTFLLLYHVFLFNCLTTRTQTISIRQSTAPLKKSESSEMDGPKNNSDSDFSGQEINNNSENDKENSIIKKEKHDKTDQNDQITGIKPGKRKSEQSDENSRETAQSGSIRGSSESKNIRKNIDPEKENKETEIFDSKKKSDDKIEKSVRQNTQNIHNHKDELENNINLVNKPQDMEYKADNKQESLSLKKEKETNTENPITLKKETKEKQSEKERSVTEISLKPDNIVTQNQIKTDNNANTKKNKASPIQSFNQESELLEEKLLDPDKKEIEDDNNTRIAKIGSNINISIKGVGWVLDQYDQNVFKLIDKAEEETHTNFQLEALDEGFDTLVFAKYDENGYHLGSKKLDFEILNPKKFNEELEQKKENEQVEAEVNKPVDLQGADHFFSQKLYDLALDEYEKIYQSNPALQTDSLINYRLGFLYFNNNEYQKARPFLQTIASDGNDIHYWPALIMLAKCQVKENKLKQSVLTLLPFKGDSVSDLIPASELENGLLLLANVYKDLKYWQNAKNEYEFLLALPPSDANYASILYNLASACENNIESPDYRRAVKLYNEVYLNFPESDLSEKAKYRIQYIRRHYLYFE